MSQYHIIEKREISQGISQGFSQGISQGMTKGQTLQMITLFQRKLKKGKPLETTAYELEKMRMLSKIFTKWQRRILLLEMRVFINSCILLYEHINVLRSFISR